MVYLGDFRRWLQMVREDSFGNKKRNKMAEEKIFVDEQSQILDAYRLGVKIFEDGYRPTFVIGLWRGGSTVALVVQECLAYLGVPTQHTTIRTSYAGRQQYEASANKKETIRVHGKSYSLETLSADDHLLIVDDVCRSGRHTTAVIEQLRLGLRRNMPKEVRVAAVWKHSSTGGAQLDYFLHETDNWIVLPYELNGLSPAEIAQNKPDIRHLFP